MLDGVSVDVLVSKQPMVDQELELAREALIRNPAWGAQVLPLAVADQD
jgi:hypothetical protein